MRYQLNYKVFGLQKQEDDGAHVSVSPLLLLLLALFTCSGTEWENNGFFGAFAILPRCVLLSSDLPEPAVLASLTNSVTSRCIEKHVILPYFSDGVSFADVHYY